MNKPTIAVLSGALALGVVAASVAAPTVYIPLGTANKILIVDAATDKVVGKISDVQNIHGLAATPDGRFLVAGSFFELRPGQAAIPPKPKGMSEEEHKRHHSMPASGKKRVVGKSYVSLIRTRDNRVIRRIEVKGAVHHNAVMPDGRYAISTHTTAGGISLIDLETYKVFKTIQTGPVPNYAVVTKDGSRIYVSNAGNNTISEIDTQNWIVARNLLAGKAPEHIVLSPDETMLYVNNVMAGTVSVISLKTGKVVKTYGVGKEPHGVDISDDGKTLFVASKKDNKLTAINLADGKARRLTLKPAPYHVTTIRGTGKVYVSSRKQSIIWVVDQKRLKVVGKIPIRGEGHQMVVSTK